MAIRYSLVGIIWLLACSSKVLSASSDFEVVGNVVDTQGNPVADVDVSPFWLANGTRIKADGTSFDLQDPMQLKEFWGHVGEMSPPGVYDEEVFHTGKDGTFSIRVSSRIRAIIAMNAARTLGGIAEILDPTNINKPLKITLEPLVRVHGQMKSSVPEKSASWVHLYVEIPEDVNRPLAMNRIVSCGSFSGEFEFRLPSGSYVLDAYGASKITSENEVQALDLHVTPPPKLTIDGKASEIDLGTLDLSQAPPDRIDYEREARSQGKWYDYTEHYGEPTPDWYITDTRGISRTATVSDYRGKWLMLFFRRSWLRPCLDTKIPQIMGFYDAHSDMRDKFEIVGIYIDYTGNTLNMEQVDNQLEPIRKNLWNGRAIPFPIILDATFQNWQRYGIPGLGTIILVDPDGNLVEGDEKRLGEFLNASR